MLILTHITVKLNSRGITYKRKKKKNQTNHPQKSDNQISKHQYKYQHFFPRVEEK